MDLIDTIVPHFSLGLKKGAWNLDEMSLKSLFLTAVVSLIFVFQTGYAQEEIQCLGQDLNMTEVQLGQITHCMKEIGIVTIWKIPMEKINCFGICILEKKSLLNPEGGLDHDRIYKYIMAVMKPDKVKKPIVDGVEGCIKDHGVKVRQPNDPNCLAFMEVGICVHDVFLAHCVEG